VNVAFSRAEANRAKAERIIENLKHDPSVTIAAPVMADGMVTSVELTRSDGGYERIIIDREFFRAQQAKLWPRNSEALGCHFVPSKLYMSTFNKILDLAGKHRLRVIVNLIEDAPGSWTSDSERKCSREFMFSTIVPMLSKRGMSFVAPDFYPLIDYNNDWYFDNSHLISEGAAIYSRLLAKEIKSTLEERKW